MLIMEWVCIHHALIMLIWTHMVSAGCYLIVNCMQYYSLFKDGICGSGGRTLMVGASIAIHCLAVRTDVPCLQCTSLVVVGWHATTSALFQLMACIWSTACSAIADWAVFPDVNALLSCFRWCFNRYHSEFGRWPWLISVRVFGPSTWPVSAWGYNVPWSKSKSWEEPRSSESSPTSGVCRGVLLWLGGCPVLVVVAAM